VEGVASLSGFVIACIAAAASGAVFRPGRWYRRLTKPAWNPPDWIFGPVWTVLYGMIALAGWIVWRSGDGAMIALPLTVYAVQLVLNALWSAIFFGLRRPDLAFAEVILLWLSILATIALFHPISPLAAYLLVPYALWVGFAMVLNYRIWRLNSARIGQETVSH